MYTYALNNPINFVDSSGLAPQSVDEIVVVGIRDKSPTITFGFNFGYASAEPADHIVVTAQRNTCGVGTACFTNTLLALHEVGNSDPFGQSANVASEPGGGGSGGSAQTSTDNMRPCNQLLLTGGNIIRYSGDVSAYLGTVIGAAGAGISVLPGGQQVGLGLTSAGAALATIGTTVAVGGSAVQGYARGGVNGAVSNVAQDFWRTGLFRTAGRIGGNFGALVNGTISAGEYFGAIVDPDQIHPRESFETCEG